MTLSIHDLALGIIKETIAEFDAPAKPSSTTTSSAIPYKRRGVEVVVTNR